MPAVRVLGCLLALAAGIAAGLLGSFTFLYTDGSFPVGLFVVLPLNLAVFVTAGMALRSRTGAALAAAGWFVTALLVASVRPGGDVIVPNSVLGNVWLPVGMLVAGLSLAVPYAAIAAKSAATIPAESSGTAPTRR